LEPLFTGELRFELEDGVVGRLQKRKAAVATTASQAHRLLTAAVNRGPRLTGLTAIASINGESWPFIYLSLSLSLSLWMIGECRMINESEQDD